ncbi:hypothetical protein SAMN05443529_12358 [Desulfosporosinus hippei DSM 8344]|uniref:Two-component sensor histidine kinase n=1 Tax=Desulfosporosinus hippei DSM 8344 TaxID=1121419 RepID=A0A1G8GU16_9FIRM|nr:hypothetical protein SAMN05443529_12358 [Desulfosporosinus hippei DSM 8344]
MKKISLNKIFRILMIILSILVLFIVSNLALMYYVLVIQDAPPPPTESNIKEMKELLVFWIVLVVENSFLILFTKNKEFVE